MRLSNYNLFFMDKEEKYIVYNTLSNKWTFYEPAMETCEKSLIEIGAVTSLSDEEENFLCDNVYYKGIYSNQLDLTIITTWNCNFDCVYCAQKHENKMMSSDIYDRIEKYILKNINEFSILHITLFGGEPTLAIENYEGFLVKVKELCKYYHKFYSVTMITNGYLLSEEMVKRLYRLRVTEYIVTLDGDPKLHDKFRILKNGSGTFDVIYKNLEKISQCKELHSLRVIIRINAIKKTIDGIKNWIKKYEKLLSDNRFSMELSIVENRDDKSERLQPLIINYDSKEYLELRKTIDSEIPEKTEKMDWISTNSYICSYLRNHALVVDWNGDVRACSKLYEENIIGTLMSNGNLSVDCGKYPLFNTKHDLKCRGCAYEPLCQGKRCGFKTICIKNRILEDVKEKMRREGVEIWKEIKKEEIPNLMDILS